MNVPDTTEASVTAIGNNPRAWSAETCKRYQQLVAFVETLPSVNPPRPSHSLPPSIDTRPRPPRSARINPYLLVPSLALARSPSPSSRVVSVPLGHARLPLARAFFCLWSNSQHPSARSGLQSTSRTRHRRDPEDPSTVTNPLDLTSLAPLATSHPSSSLRKRKKGVELEPIHRCSRRFQ